MPQFTPQFKSHPGQARMALDPIPFPRESAWSRDENGAGPRGRETEASAPYRFAANSATRQAESALDRAQRQMDRLKALLGDQPGGDDRPHAA